MALEERKVGSFVRPSRRTACASRFECRQRWEVQGEKGSDHCLRGKGISPMLLHRWGHADIRVERKLDLHFLDSGDCDEPKSGRPSVGTAKEGVGQVEFDNHRSTA